MQHISIGLLLLAVGCATHPPPVQVVGPSKDVQALAGHWAGEYGSTVTGRSGSIDFTLSAHGDSATGVIMMVPAGFGRPLRPWHDPSLGPEPGTAATPSALTIRLVRIEGSQVQGELSPYADPETGERVATTFEGRQTVDTIAGTFVSKPGATLGGVTGEWRVVRERP